MDRETLIRAVEVLSSEPNQTTYAPALRSAGFGSTEAEVLADILPEAFAIPVLEDLGISSISEVASARTRHGRWVKVDLSKNAIFVAALSLAREHRASGVFAQSAYRAIAEGSALIAVASKALNAGDTLQDGSVAIAFSGASAENLGYRPWYRSLW